MKILMVSAVNYGPENLDGTKKILYNIIKRNSSWQIDYICFNDNMDYAALDNVTNYFVSNLPQTNYFKQVYQPHALQNYDYNAIADKMNRKLEEKSYNLIILVSAVMAKLIDYIPVKMQKKTILLAIDSMSLFWRRRFQNVNLIQKSVYYWQYLCWKYYEQKYYKKFTKAIFVSDIDCEFCRLGNLMAIPNGVDTVKFSLKENVQAEDNSIIFTGNMHYFPNRNAVQYLLNNIYPKLKLKYNNLKVYIVGLGSETLTSEFSGDNIFFKDYVEDLAEYLLRAKVYVSPLMYGAGIKNKILEAMSTGRLIVASPISYDGIKGVYKDDVYIAHNDDEYIKYIEECLNMDELQAAAKQKRLRDLIVNEYSWDSIAQKYNDVFQEVSLL